MRKLRKKIYKYTSTHRPAKKPRDSIHDILALLKPRKLPDFLVDSIKKRRNFDLSSIKNVVVPPGSDSMEMRHMGSQQEAEIQELFSQHKSRMEIAEKKALLKMEKRRTNFSETEEDSFNGSLPKEESNVASEAKESHGLPSMTHDSEDPQMREDYDYGQHHGFLTFEQDFYSEEEWLKFWSLIFHFITLSSTGAKNIFFPITFFSIFP